MPERCACFALCVFFVAVLSACGGSSGGDSPDGGPQGDPQLLALATSLGILNPAFDPDVTAYQVAIGALGCRTNLNATAPDGATITVNGVEVSSGADLAVAIGTETTVVTIEVDDQGVVLTYTITFIRVGGLNFEELLPPVSDIDDFFGHSVAISGDTAVVGAPGESSSAAGGVNDNSTTGAGAAFVCVRTGNGQGVWTLQAILKAPVTGDGYDFGSDVAIDGDTIVVGEPGVPNGSTLGPDQGQVHVFQRTGTSWSLEQTLDASNRAGGDLFGRRVAISGETIVVGAPGEDADGSSEFDNSAPESGAAYVFFRTGPGAWAQQAYLKPMTTEAGDFFGVDVSIDVDTVVVGAVGEDASTAGGAADNSTPDSGAAYVFFRSAMVWNQQAYLKASNADMGDTFGVAVDVQGDTLVVGATGESASSPGDNSTTFSGAAYVFVRSGMSWSLEAYLKASNAGDFDSFGGAVAVLGDDIVVGAQYESSCPFSLPTEDDEFQAGAAYWFQRSTGTWSEMDILKGPVAMGSWYGVGVDLSSEFFVVGAEIASPLDGSAIGGGATYAHARP